MPSCYEHPGPRSNAEPPGRGELLARDRRGGESRQPSVPVLSLAASRSTARSAPIAGPVTPARLPRWVQPLPECADYPAQPGESGSTRATAAVRGQQLAHGVLAGYGADGLPGGASPGTAAPGAGQHVSGPVLPGVPGRRGRAPPGTVIQISPARLVASAMRAGGTAAGRRGGAGPGFAHRTSVPCGRGAQTMTQLRVPAGPVLAGQLSPAAPAEGASQREREWNPCHGSTPPPGEGFGQAAVSGSEPCCPG